MFKLLVMLGTFLLVALTVLALRMQRLEVTSQTAKIHNEIQLRRQTLLDQRVQIARKTNPWALADGLKAAGMDAGTAMASKPLPGNRNGTTGPVVPRVETDLVAPLIDRSVTGSNGAGHSNPNRPRQ